MRRPRHLRRGRPCVRPPSRPWPTPGCALRLCPDYPASPGKPPAVRRCAYPSARITPLVRAECRLRGACPAESARVACVCPDYPASPGRVPAGAPPSAPPARITPLVRSSCALLCLARCLLPGLPRLSGHRGGNRRQFTPHLSFGGGLAGPEGGIIANLLPKP